MNIHYRFWALLIAWGIFTVGLLILPLFYIVESFAFIFYLAGPLTFVFIVTGWIIGVCLHEYAHAISAYREGDYLTKIRGYLTLDPVRYISWRLSFLIPLIILILGGVPLPGAAVRIDLDALKNSRSQTKVALAGPATTLAFAVSLFIAYMALNLGGAFTVFLRGAVGLLAFFNLVAFFINILPIPGLDGFLALEPYLTGRWHHRIMNLANRPMLALVVLLIVIILALFVFAPLTHVIMSAAGVQTADLDAAMECFRFWAKGI